MSDAGETASVDELLTEARGLIEERPAEAMQKLRALADHAPDHPEALRLAGVALRKLGEWSRAAKADAQVVLVRSRAPELVSAKHALDERKPAVAERILKGYLEKHPDDPAALSMLAGLAEQIGRMPEAETLLRRALAVVPSFPAARFDLAVHYYRTGRFEAALADVEKLIAEDPDQPAYLNLKANVLGTLGRVDEALAILEDITVRWPDDAKLWVQYGNQLRAVGRQEESVAAFRRALALDPSFGPVWWSLANLKTVKLDADDIAAMRAQLERPDLESENRIHIHFAIAKAFEDVGDHASAFEHYAQGNRLRRATSGYRPEEITRLVEESEACFTRAFFEARSEHGSAASGPIFVLGMPRAGSTLVEQILSSHPDIEATAELAYVTALAMELREKAGGYPDSVAALGQAECTKLGERYLSGAARHRQLGRRFFIDKNPNNWMHVGLIHLLLPNARIIDVRRHPLGCGVSNFRQLFARGQSFSYSLEEMGLYYRDYVRLMRHMDEVLPGRIHRVIYEDLVDDFEAQLRAMLDYVGVAFDPDCLAFQENARAVRTPSSLQVRQPLNRDGANNWRPFEPWLDPLKQALGPVLDDYRG